MINNSVICLESKSAVRNSLIQTTTTKMALRRVDDDEMEITASSSKDIEAEKQTQKQFNSEFKHVAPQALVENYPRCKMSVTLTLKYPEPASGLVELIDHSGVYLHADKLAVYKRMSNDPINLARILVAEVFTTIALTTCAVTNTGHKAIGYNEKLVKHATNTLLEFVIEHGWFEANFSNTVVPMIFNINGNNWTVTQDHYDSIRKGIDLKMQEMRRAGHRELDEERSKEKLTVHDKNDSRWTLKHREYAPGLVELVQHSGVYVNADNLADCKRLSKDSNTLVQLLLHEIFTMCALTACQVTDARTRYNLTKLDGMGLDEHAMVILVNFTEKYGREQGWKLENSFSIRDCVCCYLREIRGTWEFWF